MTVATLSAEKLIAAKLKHLGISLSTFAVLAGLSVATVSRWLSGTQRLPNSQATSLLDLIATIEELHQKLHPVVPDLAHKDAVFMLRKFRTGRLLVHPVIDADPDGSLTREELQAIKDCYAAGLAALSNKIVNEQMGDAAQ
jgi:transcriptional regulator with XRE-family HTH domain